MRELTIVQLNDLHGYLESHPEWVWAPEGFRYQRLGGLARIKAVVEDLRRESPNLLFADCGDTFHGTHPVVESEGACLVPILRGLGLSAMTGHWDFAYGPERLRELTNQLPYPFLAANVYSLEDERLVFPPVTKIDLGPIRVGMIGLACNIVDKVMPPSFSKDIRFTEGREELPRYIAQLREREHCDVVVLLSHLGFPQDLALLEAVPGVDVCLSAHTHNRLERPVRVGETIVMQSGCHGSFIGVLKLGVENGNVSVLQHRLMAITEELPEDRETAALVADALRPGRAKLAAVVGHTTVSLNRATMLESNADNLLLDAMRAATGTELAFVNGWRYGAPIPAGAISLDALYNLVPMDPEVMTVTLRGQEVWELLEENLERTFSREAFGQMGGYVKRCGGMKTWFKAENPNGTRVQEIFVGSEPLDRDRRYSASFVTMQAVPERYGSDRRGTGVHLINATTTYLRSGGSTSGCRGSFVEV